MRALLVEGVCCWFACGLLLDAPPRLGNDAGSDVLKQYVYAPKVFQLSEMSGVWLLVW